MSSPIPFIIPCIPLAFALIILVTGEHIRANVREALTMTAAVTAAILVYSLIPEALDGTVYETTLFELADGISFSFKNDAAGMIFASVASTLWIVTSVYSIGYMRGHKEINLTGYFAGFATCIGAALGIAFSANLFTFFIFYELLTVATYPLVVHSRNDKAKVSGRKYLGYTLVTGQIFLACIAYIYIRFGTLDFVAGGFISPDSLGQGAMLFLFICSIMGGLTKAGVIPFHSWLPSAMVAPTPVSALLHAVAVVKAGAFCVLRVVCFVFGPETVRWCNGSTVLSILAAATILIASFIALRKDNLKERLAYSTIGQLSYIVLGIAILTPYSIAGALYHIVAHAFIKITMFMCAGAIMVTAHLTEISDMGGLARRMPVTMSCFTISSLGIAGLPLLPGFFSKMNILRGAFTVSKPIFAAVLMGAAVLAIGYLIPVVKMVFRGSVTSPSIEHGGEASKMMLIPIVITTILAVLLGLKPDLGLHLYELATMAADAIMGGL